MSDTSYWPEVLVDELRNVVRESKFDFIAASEKLSKWWLSNESNVTAADRGMDISGIDKATIEITSASVRVNFARDYKDAPFKTAVVSSVSQETKTISPKATASTDVSSNQNQDLDSATNTIIELAEDDDAFNFDSVEGEINNISNNENTATGEGEEKSSFSFTSTTNELATSTNLVDVDDLTYVFSKAGVARMRLTGMAILSRSGGGFIVVRSLTLFSLCVALRSHVRPLTHTIHHTSHTHYTSITLTGTKS